MRSAVPHRWMVGETKHRWVGPLHLDSPAPIRRRAQLFKAQLHYKQQQACGIAAISPPHLPGPFNNGKQHTWNLITAYQSHCWVFSFSFLIGIKETFFPSTTVSRVSFIYAVFALHMRWLTCYMYVVHGFSITALALSPKAHAGKHALAYTISGCRRVMQKKWISTSVI